MTFREWQARALSDFGLAPDEVRWLQPLRQKISERLRGIAAELTAITAQLERTATYAGKQSDAPAPTALLTADAVAARTGLSKQRIYELVRQKRLPHVKIGRQVRVSPAALEKWIADGGAA